MFHRCQNDLASRGLRPPDSLDRTRVDNFRVPSCDPTFNPQQKSRKFSTCRVLGGVYPSSVEVGFGEGFLGVLWKNVFWFTFDRRISVISRPVLCPPPKKNGACDGAREVHVYSCGARCVEVV